MIQEVLSITGEPKDKIELPDAIFGQKARKDLLWETVNRHLANQRQGTAKTKTRAEVSGGGKKPWRQKHTGMARHGSTRSPIWRHGGVVFGPVPRDYSLRIPASKRQLALRVALSTLCRENRVRVIEDFDLASHKTKELAKVMNDLGLRNEKTMLVVDQPSANLRLAARNMANLSLMRARDLNVYQALVHRVIVFTQNAVQQLAAVGEA